MSAEATATQPTSRAFPSKFSGNKCATCGQYIYVGDLIRWSRKAKGVVYHDQCYMKDYVKSETLDTAFSSQQETPKMAAPAQVTVTATPMSDLASTLALAVAPYLGDALKTKVDENTVIELVKSALAPMQARIDALQLPTRVEVTSATAGEVKDMGLQHHSFPMLLSIARSVTSDGHHLNVWLTGPAGSGKTTAASAVAKALDLPFAFTGALDQPYGLLGFIDAHGKTVRTPFREVYETGGVFLFDEYDASSSSATLPFNAALANGHCAFPDAVVDRHVNFIAIAAANTWGLGATTDYVGRNKLDAASLDRFVSLPWDVDEALELATAGNATWTKRVQNVRQRVREKGIKVIISPRASYYGSALLASGMDQETVERIVLQRGMSDDQWQGVKQASKGDA